MFCQFSDNDNGFVDSLEHLGSSSHSPLKKSSSTFSKLFSPKVSCQSSSYSSPNSLLKNLPVLTSSFDNQSYNSTSVTPNSFVVEKNEPKPLTAWINSLSSVEYVGLLMVAVVVPLCTSFGIVTARSIYKKKKFVKKSIIDSRNFLKRASLFKPNLVPALMPPVPTEKHLPRNISSNPDIARNPEDYSYLKPDPITFPNLDFPQNLGFNVTEDNWKNTDLAEMDKAMMRVDKFSDDELAEFYRTYCLDYNLDISRQIVYQRLMWLLTGFTPLYAILLGQAPCAAFDDLMDVEKNTALSMGWSKNMSFPDRQRFITVNQDRILAIYQEETAALRNLQAKRLKKLQEEGKPLPQKPSPKPSSPRSMYSARSPRANSPKP